MPISASLKPSTQKRPGTLNWNDFSGGLNADHAAYPLALAENELPDILNYKYIRHGNLVKLKSRDGCTKQSTGGAAGAAIKDIFLFSTNAGVDYYVVVADSDLKYLNGSNSFTKIDDLSSTRGRMCQFNDKLIIADGGVLKSWNGSTFAELTDTTANSTTLTTYTTNTAAMGGSAFFSTYNRYAQYFTTPGWGTGTRTLTSITFRLSKFASPTGNITAKVYAADGTTVLATSGTTLDSSTVASTATNYSFTFSLALNASTSYYFAILFSGGDADNYINIYIDPYGSIPGLKYYFTTEWIGSATTSLAITASLAPKSPAATFVIHKQNRIYCNDVLNPNWLWYCNANDPNDWSTTNGGGYIIFDGHYQLTGAHVYNDEIYVFASNPRAVYKLSGDSPDEYTVQLMWKGVTAISQDVIQDVGSDLIFTDVRGIMSLRLLAETGDIEKSCISINKVNNTYVLPYSSQISAKTINDNQYWLSTTGNYVIAYDQELGIWTRYQFELGDGVTPTAFGVALGWTFMGCSDGHLYFFNYSYDQDNGTDFSLVAKTNWHDFGVLFDKDARFIDSVVVSANQETYDLEIYINLNTVTPLKTLSLVSLSQNGAFQSPYCGNLNEVNFNFKQIQAKVTAIASGTGPHWLDRIVVEAAILSHF